MSFDRFKQMHHSDFKLVIVGEKKWWTSTMQQAYDNMQFKNDVVFTGRLSNDELCRVLGSAMALTFIPYYEGFGIPLVEAMEAEIPIITSNISSLPEVAGNAALKVNPFDLTEIKNAMLRIYNNASVRAELIKNGRLQKLNFSWDRSAQLLWESMVKAIRE